MKTACQGVVTQDVQVHGLVYAKLNRPEGSSYSGIKPTTCRQVDPDNVPVLGHQSLCTSPYRQFDWLLRTSSTAVSPRLRRPVRE